LFGLVHVDMDFSHFFEFGCTTMTTGHTYKLY